MSPSNRVRTPVRIGRASSVAAAKTISASARLSTFWLTRVVGRSPGDGMTGNSSASMPDVGLERAGARRAASRRARSRARPARRRAAADEVGEEPGRDGQRALGLDLAGTHYGDADLEVGGGQLEAGVLRPEQDVGQHGQRASVADRAADVAAWCRYVLLEEPAECRRRAPAGRRRRSPAGRSPARPSPVAATGAATGSPPEAAAERDSERPPSRVPVRSPGRIAWSRARSGGPCAARSGCDRIVPCSWSAAKSCGRESITSRGRRPRPVVRPTGACDRGPGVRPGRGVRPSSSYGRGSRAPWRGGASWAGRSASSSLRAILSIRPRGSVRHRPQKARKRADRPMHGRGAFNVRRMIGRARSAASNERRGPVAARARPSPTRRLGR